jgi:tetratricopeptide (TPR) repeat protein
MAQIFLSYAREDVSVAKRVAGALEGAGHSVWWDRHISAGSRFSAEIAAALEAADAVVVLWSQASIESVWVQDEAAFGRDHGRLVPAVIGSAEPPLGFRQFQAVDLGKAGRKVAPLLDAVASKLGQPAAPAHPLRRSATGSGRKWLAAVAGLIALVAAVWMMVLRGPGETTHVLTVAAAEGGDARQSAELARTIATDLGRFRAGPLGALTILGAEERVAKADYRVQVGVSQLGAHVRSDISLLSSKGNVLWTTSEQGTANEVVDLRQRAAVKLGHVLACAIGAKKFDPRISNDVLGLYLSGCGQMGDQIFFEPDQELLSILRQVTERAPGFAPGWAALALVEAQSFPGTPPSERAELRKQLVAHLAMAKRLGPDLPETIAAEAYFHPHDGTRPQHALAVLDRGVERYPDSALLHHMRALFLADVGRQNDSILAAERAQGINPLSPLIRDAHISALAYAGRTGAAYKALAEAEALWPGSAVLEQVRYRLDLRYGDPSNALRILRERGGGDLKPLPGDIAWEAFLEARLRPTAANIEGVLDGFRQRYHRNPADVPGYLQALGTFGRVDEAYEVLKPDAAMDSMLANTEILFRQHMRPIRSDPRFISLAARLGLLALWEKSGAWADFCSEPQLPYECREEAAKLTPEQRRLARFIPSG